MFTSLTRERTHDTAVRVGTTHQGSNARSSTRTTERSWVGALGVGGTTRRLRWLDILPALGVYDCEWEADLSEMDGAWLARCPLCRIPKALRIREVVEWYPWEDNRPFVCVECTEGCDVGELMERFLMSYEALVWRRHSERWETMARWLYEVWRRAMGL